MDKANMQIQFARLLRDPLVGFVLAGSLVFLAYSHFGEQPRPSIVVTEAAVSDLVEERRLVLNREISRAEREALIAGYVDHEVLISEAVVRGLYRSDAKVRKRLADKMYFLLDEEPPEPTEAQLQARFDANPNDYLTPRAVTFEHVYFKNDRTAADSALAAIQSGGARAEDLGQVFWLGRRMERYSGKQLIVVMGLQFERALRALPTDSWQGPLRSGRGWHLVRVLERHEPRLLPEVELNSRLADDWKADWRRQRRAETFADLRAQYNVVLPEGDSGG